MSAWRAWAIRAKRDDAGDKFVERLSVFMVDGVGFEFIAKSKNSI
jgi:hypothetical protein